MVQAPGILWVHVTRLSHFCEFQQVRKADTAGLEGLPPWQDVIAVIDELLAQVQEPITGAMFRHQPREPIAPTSPALSTFDAHIWQVEIGKGRGAVAHELTNSPYQALGSSRE